MKLDISIRSSVPIDLMYEEKIADGITIQRRNILRESISPAIYSDFIFIVQNLVMPIAATLIANLLYDKLKGRKDTTLTINYEPVEINIEKIEQLIITIEKEQKD